MLTYPCTNYDFPSFSFVCTWFFVRRGNRQLNGPCGAFVPPEERFEYAGFYDVFRGDEPPSNGGRVQLDMNLCCPFGDYELTMVVNSTLGTNPRFEARSAFEVENGPDEVRYMAVLKIERKKIDAITKKNTTKKRRYRYVCRYSRTGQTFVFDFLNLFRYSQRAIFATTKGGGGLNALPLSFSAGGAPERVSLRIERIGSPARDTDTERLTGNRDRYLVVRYKIFNTDIRRLVYRVWATAVHD